jgi:high-affinity iron transporter
VTWADSVPNLLIGLREGLEAGLVVTILLAAVRKTAAARASASGTTAPAVSTAPIWLGVLGAVTLSGAFAAILTFSVSVLTSAGQEAVGGLLSVLAVCLVTAMIFWMRRTAATLSAHLRGEVARAAAVGTGALTLTAFLAVGREGLETTLFLWTAAKASGQTAGPLIGAAIGIAAAIILCWLLYRRAIHLNVGVFFNRTAIALIVIAAGVLAYGLGDLQDANWLPGHSWVAFDLTAHIDPGSWWASIITGITELSPKMTVLQVTAWLAYLVVVIPAFVTAGRTAVRRPATAASTAAASTASVPAASTAAASTDMASTAAPAAANGAAPAAANGAAPVAATSAAGEPVAAATAVATPVATTTALAEPVAVPASAPAASTAAASTAETTSAASAAGTSAAVPAAANGAGAGAGKGAGAGTPAPAAGAGSGPGAARQLPRWERVAGSRPWLVAGVLVAVPALAAGVTIAAVPAAKTSTADVVTVSRTDCAPEWSSAQPGTQTISVTNNSGLAGEINLDNAAGAVVGEIETIGPGTSAPLTATLGSGTYTFRCLMGSKPVTASQPVTVSANTGTTVAAPAAIKPVTLGDITPPNKLYQVYAAGQLTDLTKAVTVIENDLRHNNIPQAKKDWLTAQLDWERVGASYDSFGDLGLAVDGTPDGLPNGVNDTGFTGLHRLEYGLYNGQSAKELLPVTQTLAKNVATVRKNLTTDDEAGDPTQLPLRVHEIIEDALRDHLSGIDNQGAGEAYAMTYADTQVDKVVLGEEANLINERQPGLVATANSQLATLDRALLATQANGQWQSLTAVGIDQRSDVDAAIGALLETLAEVPNLLEVPPSH